MDGSGFWASCFKNLTVNLLQVPPAELEDLLRLIFEIEDVAVIGVPDSKDGEAPRAYVVLKKDAKMSEEEIHKFVDRHVSLSFHFICKNL